MRLAQHPLRARHFTAKLSVGNFSAHEAAKGAFVIGHAQEKTGNREREAPQRRIKAPHYKS